MNSWVKKSIKIAGGQGYLDRLYGVYPMDVGEKRTIDEKVLKEISSAFKKKDKRSLIKTLLDNLDLFPIKDSYIAFLRRNPVSITKNPKTIERIGARLLGMGFDKVINASTQPKETNRQIGPLFQRWLPSLGYPLLPPEEFLKYDGTAFLEGSDKVLKDFSNKYLETKLTKGLDLLLKTKDKFVIGEAKFLTDFGGHQNAQFNDAINLLHSKGGKVIRIAVLDGVLWINGNNKMHNSIKSEKGQALSALLLKDFIENL